MQTEGPGKMFQCIGLRSSQVQLGNRHGYANHHGPTLVYSFMENYATSLLNSFLCIFSQQLWIICIGVVGDAAGAPTVALIKHSAYANEKLLPSRFQVTLV